MISAYAFDLATQVALNIKDVNKGLVAMEDTPVGRLVAPLVAPNLFLSANGVEHSIQQIVGLLQKTAVVDGVDPYDYNLKQFVELASTGVRNTIKLTKGVALPIIEDITTKIEDAILAETQNRGLAVNIVDDGHKAILDSSILTNAVERYMDIALPRVIETAPYHAVRTTADILELMKVGMGRFDEEVQHWLACVSGNEKSIELYSKVFVNGTMVTNLENVIGKGSGSYVNALIIFLIALGLNKNLDDNINLSKSEYEKVMSSLICYSGIIIKEAISKRARSNLNKNVVESFPPAGEEYSYHDTSKGVITVNAKLYEQFLSQGGSPEVVIGAYLSNRETELDKLLVDKDKYTKVYNVRILQARSDNSNRGVTILRKQMINLIYQEIEHCKAEAQDKGLWSGITISTDTAYDKADKLVKGLTVLDVDNVYLATKHVVLETFFETTDVHELLTYIDSAKTVAKPDDLQSAVNVAIIDYVVNWFLSQTKVTI